MTLTRQRPAETRSTWGRQDSIRLAQGLTDLGLTATAAQMTQLRIYGELLLKWNRTYNLLGAADAATLVQEHLLDSLAVLPAITRWLPPANAELRDVGSGAGLPGVVLAIMLERLPVALIEPNGKKAAFLRQTVAECGLETVRVIEARIETLAAQGAGWRHAMPNAEPRFSTPHFICRAFTSLARFADLCRPSLQDGSLLFAMKAARVGQELQELGDRVEVLAVEPLRAAAKDVQRNLVVMRSTPTHPAAGYNTALPLSG